MFCFFLGSYFNFQQPQQSLPVLTSSGRIHSVAVNDHVFLVEDLQYRVTKIFPEEGSVRLQKINCRNRPFKRSLKHIWLPPLPLVRFQLRPICLPQTAAPNRYLLKFSLTFLTPLCKWICLNGMRWMSGFP